MAALNEQQAELEHHSLLAWLPRLFYRAFAWPMVLGKRRRCSSSRRAPVYREAESAAYKKVRHQGDEEAGYTILAPQMALIHFELAEEFEARATMFYCCLGRSRRR